MNGRRRLPPIPSAPFRDSKRLARLQSHLQRNPTQPFPAVEAAHLVNLHKAYFSVFFRERVGRTFSSWVRCMRLRRALELLRKTRLPISEIASQTGFGSTRSLQRATQELMGCSPRSYRKRFRRDDR